MADVAVQGVPAGMVRLRPRVTAARRPHAPNHVPPEGRSEGPLARQPPQTADRFGIPIGLLRIWSLHLLDPQRSGPLSAGNG